MKVHQSELLVCSILCMSTVALELYCQIEYKEGWGAFLNPSDY